MGVGVHLLDVRPNGRIGHVLQARVITGCIHKEGLSAYTSLACNSCLTVFADRTG